MVVRIDKESLRLRYLQDLGVQSWVPRFELSDMGAEELSSKARQNAISRGEVLVENEHSESQLQVEMESVVENIPSLESVLTVTESKDILQFAFAFLAVSDMLAVICEIPYHSRGRLQSPARNLLMRILDALAIPVRTGSTPVIHFQWPLLHDTAAEHGEESARQTLHGFLGRQFKEKPVPFLLVFGEQWPSWLFPEGFTPPDYRSLFKHPQFGTDVLVARGLHAMQVDESVKKPVWQQLQILKVKLSIWHEMNGKL